MSTVGIFNSIHHRQVERQKERNREYDKAHKSTTTNQQYNIINTPDIGSIRAAENFIYMIDKYTKFKIITEYNSTEDYFNSDVDEDNNLNIITIYDTSENCEVVKLIKFKENNSIKVKYIADIIQNNKNIYSCNIVIEGYSQLIEWINEVIQALEERSQFSMAHEFKKCC